MPNKMYWNLLRNPKNASEGKYIKICKSKICVVDLFRDICDPFYRQGQFASINVQGKTNTSWWVLGGRNKK